MKRLPTWPLAVVMLVTTGVAGTTVRVKLAVPVPPALMAEIVTVVTTEEVGLPEMIPEVEFTLKPAGKLLAPKEVGLLDAVIW